MSVLAMHKKPWYILAMEVDFELPPLSPPPSSLGGFGLKRKLQAIFLSGKSNGFEFVSVISKRASFVIWAYKEIRIYWRAFLLAVIFSLNFT